MSGNILNIIIDFLSFRKQRVVFDELESKQRGLKGPFSSANYKRQAILPFTLTAIQSSKPDLKNIWG